MSPKLPKRFEPVALGQVEVLQALVTLGHEVPAAEVGQLRGGDEVVKAIKLAQEQAGIEVTGELDATLLERLRERVEKERPAAAVTVEGAVRAPDGRPIPGAIVAIRARDLDGEAEIARALADLDGRYAAAAPAERLSGTQRAAVVVAVLDAEGNEVAVAAPRFADADRLEVDVEVDSPKLRPASERQRLAVALHPLVGERPLWELDAEHLQLLSGATGQPPAAVAEAVAGDRLAKTAGWPESLGFAFVRAGMPADVAGVLAHGDEALVGAWQEAVDANVVDRDDMSADQVRKLLHQARIDALATPRLDGGDGTGVADLLAVAVTDEAERRAVVEIALETPDDPAAMWSALRERSPLDDEAVGTLQRVLQLGALTEGDVKLAESLHFNAPATLDGLARWTAENIAETGAVSLEKGLLVKRNLEAAFPAASLAGSFADADGDDELIAVLGDNPRFDPRTRPANEIAGDSETLAAKVAAAGRTFKLAGNAADAAKLYAAGVTSALRAVELGEETLRSTVEGSFALGIEGLVDKARKTVADAIAALTVMHDDFDAVGMNVLPTQQLQQMVQQPQGMPSLAELFGSADFCRCEHCRSVYSPAAYLVDLLAFLRRSPAGPSGKTALQVLEARRADLIDVELSCRNTNTPLPYVDLVCEVLEAEVRRVEGNPPPAPAKPVATTLPADRLLASPEHVDHAAYAHLAAARFPWSLPFDLPLLQARVFLDHLGVPRADLLEAFAPAEQARLAAERLGLGAADVARLAPNTTDPWVDWGLTAGGGSWWSAFAPAEKLVAAAGVGFDELRQLIASLVVDPGGDVSLTPAHACRLEDYEVDGLDAAVLDRLRRFERLRRRMGLTVPELDALVLAVGGGSLDGTDLLARLADAERVRRRTRLAADVVASWWSWMPAAALPGATPLYQRVFEDPAVVPPGSGANPLALNALHLPQGPGTPAQLAERIAAALRLTTDDVHAVLATITAPALDRATLSVLHRWASLAEALGWTVADVLALARVSGLDPFASPAASMRFLEAADRVTAAGMAPKDLALLLGGRPAPPAVPVAGAPADSADEELIAVGDALRRLRDDSPPLVDETGALLLAALTAVLPAEAADVHALAAGTLAGDGDAHRTLLASAAVRGVLDPERTIPRLVGPATLPAGAEPPAVEVLPPGAPRFGFLLGELAARERMRTAAVQLLAGAHALTESAALALLERIPVPGGAATKLLDALVAPPTLHADTPAARKPVRDALERLARAAATLEPLRLGPATADVLGLAAQLGVLDVAALPLDPDAAGAPARFAGWERLADLATLLRRVRPAAGALLAGLRVALETDPAAAGAAARRDEWLAAVAPIRGWGDARFAALVGAQGLALAWPQAFTDPATYSRIQRCVDQLDLLGVGPGEVLRAGADAWVAGTVTAAAATAIRSAAAARSTPAAWPTVARPLQDDLRRAQRNALIAHLVHRLGLDGPGALVDRLLIDVEMDPCQLTSRVKQAIGSVQMLVQRARLGIEPEIRLSGAQHREWLWLGAYRVWEANRKVLLYPENWLDPALRTDKTAPAKAFEEELLQGEVTLDAAATAFDAYLDGLDEVARLTVVGVHEEPATDDEPAVVHVIGRSSGVPRKHYHRMLIDGREWTPWTSIPLDIAGDHVAPVVVDGRLRLFWITSEERPADQNPQPSETPVAPEKVFEAKLAWSELRKGRWDAKRLTPTGVTLAEDELPSAGLLVTKEEGRPLHIGLAVSSEFWAEKGLPVAQRGSWTLSGCQGEPLPPPSVAGTLILAFFQVAYEWNVPEELVFDSTGASVYPAVPTTIASLRGAEPGGYTVGASNPTILGRTPTPYHVAARTVHDPWPLTGVFGFSDRERTFLVRPRSAGRQRMGRAEWAKVIVDDDAIALVDMTRVAAGTSAIEVLDPRVMRRPGTVTFTHEEVIDRSSVIARSSVIGRSPVTRSAAGVPISTELTLAEGIFDKAVAGGDWGDLAVFGQDPLRYGFDRLYHPVVCQWQRRLARGGLPRLLTLEAQYDAGQGSFADYQAKWNVDDPVRTDERADFGGPRFDAAATAFGTYDWEAFYHLPVLVADRLSDAGRHEDARTMLHAIFDPTATETVHPLTGDVVTDVRRVWRFRPFFEANRPRTIQALVSLLSGANLSDEERDDVDAFRRTIEAWRRDPFKPHAVARLRPGAYQRAVVDRYVRNLIRWADSLFARDSIEAINEATTLYLLAAAILGDRPRALPAAETADDKSFRDIAPRLDDLSNALVELEGVAGTGGATATGDGGALETVISLARGLYFCVPHNEKLLELWDLVEDRLHKIRNCQSLEGITRQLALFEPPLDPGALVRAAAAGRLGDAIAAARPVTLPHHRYAVMHGKALELCADVRALGGALLSAIERRDAEAMALLRSGHERELLDAMRDIREKHIEDAQHTLDSLRASKQAVDERRRYYATRQRISASEKLSADMLVVQSAFRTVSSMMQMVASALNAIPTFSFGIAGWAGTPQVSMSIGGGNAAAVAGAAAIGVGSLGDISGTVSQLAGINASHERRWDDWQMQIRVADHELRSLDRQLDGAQLRLDIARKELTNHDRQAEQLAAADELMRTKFTNVELFDWMARQVGDLHSQAYQLALDAARQAERCFQFETGARDGYIGSDHWDHSRRGLLAGDRLQRDLRRLDGAYMQANKREEELTKTVSIGLRDPLALERLKAEGRCEVELPEWTFDLDHPGHYMRRLRAVSITLPAVTGPYSGVNCRLTLLRNRVRTTPLLRDGKYLRTGEDDPRFQDDLVPIQTISTSRGQGDAGVFDPGARDGRYLPFEGAGADSRWRIEIDPRCNDWDLSTLADVLLELRYTARDGGDTLRTKALAEVVDARGNDGVGPLVRLFSARHEFADAWDAFLHPLDDAGGQTLALPLDRERWPYRARQGPIRLGDLHVGLALSPAARRALGATAVTVQVRDQRDNQVGPAGGLAVSKDADPALAPLPAATVAVAAAAQPGRWTIALPQATLDALPEALVTDGTDGPSRLRPEAIEDVVVAFSYRLMPGV